MAVAAQPQTREVIVCGPDGLSTLDIGGNQPKRTWVWKAVEHPELPEQMLPKLRTVDECKPVEGGSRILITSSSGGVALLERGTGKVLFYGSAVNAHSADILPRGRIAVAASHTENKPGDRLIVFDIAKSDAEVYHTDLEAGHGVVWDEQRQVLWALSHPQLLAYKLLNWNSGSPSLSKIAAYALPDALGHDLSAIPRSSMLSVTTGKRVWLFDRERRTFLPHPQLANEADVKSATVNAATGQLVYTQANQGSTSTDTLRFLAPPRVIQILGARIYKARW
jgi:hypothetical protein